MFWLWVLIRIVANPFSNVFQKLLTRNDAGPLFIICVTHGLLSLACVPIFIFFLTPLSGEFWFNIVICTFLCVCGNVLIVEALKRSDLSLLGPINAYKSVISLIPGMILLNEFPGLLGLSGIVLIVVGSYFILDKDVNEPSKMAVARFLKDRAIQYRFAAIVLSATEAVFLKKALQASSALTTFAMWSVLGFGVSFAAVAVMIGAKQMKHEVSVLASNRLTFVMLFVTTGLMQLSTILVLERLQVGYSLALFQTSTLLSVVLGFKLFREGHFIKRLIGSMIMVAGAVLIIVSK